MNSKRADKEFIRKAQAREVLIQHTCAKECVGFMNKYLTMLKDKSTKQDDHEAALWNFRDCVADCAKDKQRLHS